MTRPLAMGPTELASGSHRLTNHLRNPALVSDELVYQHETTGPEQLVTEAEQAGARRVLISTCRRLLPDLR